MFCQECGQRLGPRIAPPTPPIGLGSPAPTPPNAPRAAPALSDTLGDAENTSINQIVVCPRCSTPNQPGTRFCVGCGNAVTPAAVQPAAHPPAASPIAPSPVVDLRDAAPPRAIAALQAGAPDTTRVCGRCRGTCEAGAQFCKFCGAPLGDARPSGKLAAVRPRPSAPAQAAVSIATPVATPSPLVSARALGPGATPMIPPAPDTSQYHASMRPDSASSVTYGRLVVITKDGGEGPSYPLHEQLDLGRSEGHVVIAEDRYLSPRHARISRRPAAPRVPGAPPSSDFEFVLRDLGSANGVFLRIGNAAGGDGRVEVSLRDQDLFLVGQQVIRFEVVRDAEEGLGPAIQHGTLLFGTPVAPRYARLCQRTVEGVTRDVYHVRKVETVLGRESGDIVFTDDPFLSRRHALVRYDREAKRFSLADMGSSNGTFIQIRGEVSIKSGDQFRVGQQLFRIELNASTSS